MAGVSYSYKWLITEVSVSNIRKFHKGGDSHNISSVTSLLTIFLALSFSFLISVGLDDDFTCHYTSDKSQFYKQLLTYGLYS